MTDTVLQYKLTLSQYGMPFSYRLEQGREALQRAYCAAVKKINDRTFAGTVRDLLIGALRSLLAFYEVKLDELDLRRRIKYLRATGQTGKARRLERSLARA